MAWSDAARRAALEARRATAKQHGGMSRAYSLNMVANGPGFHNERVNWDRKMAANALRDARLKLRKTKAWATASAYARNNLALKKAFIFAPRGSADIGVAVPKARRRK